MIVMCLSIKKIKSVFKKHEFWRFFKKMAFLLIKSYSSAFFIIYYGIVNTFSVIGSSIFKISGHQCF